MASNDSLVSLGRRSPSFSKSPPAPRGRPDANQQTAQPPVGLSFSNCSFDAILPPTKSPYHVDVEKRLFALEDEIGQLHAAARAARDAEAAALRRIKKAAADAQPIQSSTAFRLLRYTLTLLLVGITAYVCYALAVQWVDSGSQPTVTFSLEDVDALAMPTAGMIPAPYATDSRCFNPTPTRCAAYVNEEKAFDCLQWLSSVSTSQRTGGEPMVIWTIDGLKAAQQGFFFGSILDYVEYSFRFPPECTEPYLWVFVSGDTKIVTEARLDPSISMRSYAQSSFLIQGGQYVMVAFSMQQDVDLAQRVTNTSMLSISSMMVSAFNASLSHEATAVFRPGSFKIQTTTQQPGQTFFEFLASVGGWIGLFLGFSLIQIVELLEAIHSFTRSKWHKYQQKGQKAVDDILDGEGSDSV